MILGLRTAIYPTRDLAAGKDWYRQVLGQDPYFDAPFYVGFAVGGFELGLIPDGEPGAAGVQVYWGVPDAVAEANALGAPASIGFGVTGPFNVPVPLTIPGNVHISASATTPTEAMASATRRRGDLVRRFMIVFLSLERKGERSCAATLPPTPCRLRGRSCSRSRRSRSAHL